MSEDAERSKIIVLLKIVPTEERAKQILAGELFCSTVGALREEFDEKEGTIPIDPGSVTFRIGDKEVKGISAFTMAPDFMSNLNVYCMFSWSVPFVDDEHILLEPESQFGVIRNLACKYGEYCVVIRNVPEFLRRIEVAARSHDFFMFRGAVRYVEDGTTVLPPKPTMLNFAKACLRKRSEFAMEKEYRFIFMIDVENPKARILSIGDIQDIAGIARTNDIYWQVKVNGRSLDDIAREAREESD